MRQPFQHACSLKYPAYHHSGARGQASLRYIVLHSTEGATAHSAAEYFTHPGSGGSATLVVDDNECFRSLNDFVTPWGAPPLNSNGLHLEQAGFAKWARAEWLVHDATLQRAAFKAARWCRAYKIPPVLLDVHKLKLDFGTLEHEGMPRVPGPLEGGVTTHAVVTAAYGLSDHTDPGGHYPTDVFMAHLREWLKGDV